MVWTPPPPSRAGPDMSKIWLNLRTPARDNPSPMQMSGSLGMALFIFGVAVAILVAAGVLVWLFFR